MIMPPSELLQLNQLSALMPDTGIELVGHPSFTARSLIHGWECTLLMSGQAMPVYTPNIGSRRVAFSPGWANGHLHTNKVTMY